MGNRYPAIGGSYTLAQLDAVAAAQAAFEDPDTDDFSDDAMSCDSTYRAGDAGDGSVIRLLFSTAPAFIPFGTGKGRPGIMAKVQASDVEAPEIGDSFEMSSIRYAAFEIVTAPGGWLLTLKAPS